MGEKKKHVPKHQSVFIRGTIFETNPSRMDHCVATWKALAKAVIKSEGLAVARWRSLAACR
jgi:hypothetical protein